MPDVMSAEKRSALMSRIRAEDTGPEMLVRHYLWHAGLRYRLHPRKLPGKPDIVLPRWHVVVFVNGCFWHEHTGCPYFQLPKHRRKFWAAKLAANKRRDSAIQTALVDSGWRVAVVWECALRKNPSASSQALVAWLRSGRRTVEIEATHLYRVAHHALA